MWGIELEFGKDGGKGRRNDSRGDKNGITDFLLMLIVHILKATYRANPLTL